MKCANCGRDYVFVFEADSLCEGCYDFLNGHSSYNPAKGHSRLLEAIQEAIEDTKDNDGNYVDDDDDGDYYPDPEEYDDYWDD